MIGVPSTIAPGSRTTGTAEQQGLAWLGSSTPVSALSNSISVGELDCGSLFRPGILYDASRRVVALHEEQEISLRNFAFFKGFLDAMLKDSVQPAHPARRLREDGFFFSNQSSSSGIVQRSSGGNGESASIIDDHPTLGL